MPSHLSNLKPQFEPHTIQCGRIPAYQYKGDLASELKAKTLTREQAVDLFEDMLVIREFEEMIVKLRSGAYEACAQFNYRGPTHVSIGQEGSSVGACYGIAGTDYITSTHRGHGDSIAKGCVAIRQMADAQLKTRVPQTAAKAHADLLELALEDHIYRTAAELFGKEDGYCRGRGGGMHIADFTAGHLGANAIVGGGVPIATGAALACRYLRNDKVVCCFAGDGAYANGVVLESLNWACQHQFTNHLAKDHKFGLPIVYVILNNHYGMTGRADEEVMGVSALARRGAGFADNNMHAELVNGMDVLAVRDAVRRAAEGCREGKGPYLVEVSTYRYYGHSLSDPRNEYRMKEEEDAWRQVDPIAGFRAQLVACKVLSEAETAQVEKRVQDRNARAAALAAQSPDPDPADVIKYMYTDTTCETVPEAYRKVEIVKEAPTFKRTAGQLTYRDAIKEGIVEEMMRDRRVILYGEDVAEYGGAFKLSKGLLEAFGRERVFNTPISEAAICGTSVGAAMAGLRPVVELMYMDFALQAADQISNQAAKWHYMSGAKADIAVVVRASVGGGKGYGGQHSQSLESVFAHIPGTYVVYPSTPYDAKGLIKASIRDNNPVIYVESQLLYGIKGDVPETDYVIPLGVADVKREGKDLTIVAWGPAVHDALKAADILMEQSKTSVEVVDVRTLVPLDIETILQSVRKTGRCIVVSQSIDIGSFTGEIVSQIVMKAFDYLDAPVMKVGAKNGIAPQSHVLEAVFLPTADDIVNAAKEIL